MRQRVSRRQPEGAVWRQLTCGHWSFTVRKSNVFCHECARLKGSHRSGKSKTGRPFARRGRP